MLQATAVSSFFSNLIPGRRAKRCQEKLADIFKVRNTVRNTQTGAVFSVYDVTLGGAKMVDDGDNLHMTEWLTNDGQLKQEVADQWELVQSAPA